jgi:FkbM family methyltransferase
MNPGKLQRKALRGLWQVASAIAPASQLIPLRFNIHMWEDCEAELRYLDQIGPNQGIAVDAGANLGLFAYHMSKWYNEVYAFEVNDECTTSLEAYGADNIHVINKGLSSESGKAVLHIPIAEGEPLTGWATLDPETYPNVQNFTQKNVKVCRLDDYELSNVGLIKIDVEGHEYEVLKGAEETISQSRPHVIAEIKPQHVNTIWRFFAERSYDMTRSKNLIGVSSKRNNYIFVPS